MRWGGSCSRVMLYDMLHCFGQWSSSSHHDTARHPHFVFQRSQFRLHGSHFTLHNSSHPISPERFSPLLISSLLISYLLICHPIVLSYFHFREALLNVSRVKEPLLKSSQLYSPSRRFDWQYFSVLFCTTKLAQSTSQYDFVLHRRTHILLCITKFGDSSHYLSFCNQEHAKHIETPIASSFADFRLPLNVGRNACHIEQTRLLYCRPWESRIHHSSKASLS